MAWKDPAMSRPLGFEMNGTWHRLSALRTNVNEDLNMFIRDIGL